MGEMPPGQKVQPALDAASTRELNLTVLQRADGGIEEILTTAGHVTLYQFDLDSQQWSRKDVEGSLFVVKRRTQPRFQFIVMNRRSTENLVEDLLGDFEYEVQLPYLLYRKGNQEVNGIWFYNQKECEDVSKLFTRILNAFLRTTPKPQSLTAPSAQYQELEAIPDSARVDGPLEPPDAEISTSIETMKHFFMNKFQVGPSEAAVPPTFPAPSPEASLPHPTLPDYPASSLQPSYASLPEEPSSSSSTALPTPLEMEDIGPTTLLKPSFFTQPLPQSTAPPKTVSVPVLNPQTLTFHGAPFLQPFPPPTPSSALADHNPCSEVAVTRQGVAAAIFRLLQDDRFIDLVYQELVAAHKPP
eukprot:SM000001S04786  [mRNA]  locus=s1:2248660:2250962:+ [translate_table: standard]